MTSFGIEQSGMAIKFIVPDLIKFNFSESIWLSIARVILKAIDKLFLTPAKEFIVHVMEFRDSLIIEGEISKARIQAGKLIEVTKVYEQSKRDVDNLSNLSIEARQKLVNRLDRALDLHIDKIIEYGS
ncbi:MAG: hypothetical protein Q8M94_18225 [Ignavibacteria bacterium]|nr:hypothetical protein [Ignavibacteria bacterium]